LSPLNTTNLSNFESFLFKLYVCGCTLIIDEDDCQLEWNNNDY
jgi:hypothetical protein